MAAKNKPTKEQIAYGKARAGGQGAYKITAKEVKRTAKGVAKAAALAATVVGPGKVGKAIGIAKKTSKAVKGAQASRVKSATPSYVVTKEGKFTVSKSRTGKTVITDKSGTKYTLKKGDTVQKVINKAQNRYTEDVDIARELYGSSEGAGRGFSSQLRDSAKKISYKKK